MRPDASLRGDFLLNGTITHQDNTVCFLRDVSVVGYEDHSETMVPVETSEKTYDILRILRVKVSSRFIGPDYGRLIDKSPSYRNPETAKKEWASQKMKATAWIDDSDGKIGKAYGLKTTPHLIVIDAKGNEKRMALPVYDISCGGLSLGGWPDDFVPTTGLDLVGCSIDLPDLGGADALRAAGVAADALIDFPGH